MNFAQSYVVAQSQLPAPAVMHSTGSMGAVTAHHVPLSAAMLVTRAQTLAGAALAEIDTTPMVVVAAARAPTPTDYYATDTKY